MSKRVHPGWLIEPEWSDPPEEEEYPRMLLESDEDYADRLARIREMLARSEIARITSEIGVNQPRYDRETGLLILPDDEGDDGRY